MQEDYGAVFRELKNGKIQQAYASLRNVRFDQIAGKKGAGYIGADNYGYKTPDEFILNKNVETDSFTSK